MVRGAGDGGAGEGADVVAVALYGRDGLALDATGAMGGDRDREDASLDLLRVSVRTSAVHAGCVDIVCADTGGGISTHRIKALCCGAFETTKRAGGEKAAVTAGKYGDLVVKRPAVAAFGPSNPLLHQVSGSRPRSCTANSSIATPVSES